MIRCDECPHWGEPNAMSNAWCDLNRIYTHATTGCLERELEIERRRELTKSILVKAPPDERPKLKLVR